MFRQGSYEALPATALRAKRENGGLGEDPPGKKDHTKGLMQGPLPASSSVRPKPFYALLYLRMIRRTVGANGINFLVSQLFIDVVGHFK